MKKAVRLILDSLPIICGTAIMALGVQLFLKQGGLISSGATGIALAVENLTGIPVSVLVFSINVVMLAIAWVVLGKRFTLNTLGASLLYPAFLAVCETVFAHVALTDNTMLNTVFGGLSFGAGLGLVLRSGASTGGMDIPPLVLKKYLNIPVSVSLNALDVLIILSQAMLHDAQTLLYGILLVLIYSVVLDKVMMIGQSRMEIKVISTKSEEVRSAILTEGDRGVTILAAEGGYLRNKTDLVLTVVSGRELPNLKRIIYAIDPECFMIIARVTEVSGRGFTMNKVYGNKK